jgi:antitoxin CptB
MGSSENDIFFGSFAESHMAALSDQQVDRFERLLEASDPELFSWVTGAKPVPPEHDHDVMRMLQRFVPPRIGQ